MNVNYTPYLSLFVAQITAIQMMKKQASQKFNHNQTTGMWRANSNEGGRRSLLAIKFNRLIPPR